MSVAPVQNANIARHLGLMAAAQPTRPALKIPRGRTRVGIDYLTLSFAELDAEVTAWSDRLTRAGVHRGDRTLVMVRQGLPLIASVFALFRLGAVPIVIDPGMGRKTFLACVERSRPTALVGIPLARIISRLFRRPFATVRTRVAASGSLTARLTSPGTQPSWANPQPAGTTAASAAATDLAAILFTSGSTGTPKGVCYEHGMFDAQVRLIRDTYDIQPGEIDLPLLPIFALFNPALGMTTVVPEIDPRQPAALDPAKIVQAINQEKVTNSFGSPTLWRKIGEHCRAQNLTLPSLRRVLCAGAAVPADLWQSSRAWLPHGRLHSPYGATEALPVATISSDEIATTSAPQCNLIRDTPRAPSAVPDENLLPECNVIRDTFPFGACVGRPIAGLDVRIIGISDEPIADLGAAHEVSIGQIGEIIVRGPVVTQTYDANPAATAFAKIASREAPAAPRYHRLGDCGYLDASGRLWFCGRKAERVDTFLGTLHTEPCEQVFRQYPRATRCALIGLGERGRQRPAIVVETKISDSAEGRELARELRTLALQHERTATIKLFYFREKFPVDVRHNAKIHRLTLAKWALTATGYESDPKR